MEPVDLRGGRQSVDANLSPDANADSKVPDSAECLSGLEKAYTARLAVGREPQCMARETAWVGAEGNVS